MNTSRGAPPAESVEPQPHAVQHLDTPEAQPHIPAINEEMPDAEPQEVFTDEDDDRSEPRPEVNQHGLVVFAGQEKGLECEVMDLTTAGARLRLADDVTVPSCFELTVQPENTSKTAQVCWRNGRDLGIQFVDKG